MSSLKSCSRLGLALALSAGVGLSASAGMLSTTSSNDDGDAASGAGTFFDLTASTNLSLTRFDVFSLEDNAPGNFQIDVYYRTGSYLGSQETAGDWTLLQSFTQGPNGEDDIDELFLTTPLAMSNGATFGFYVVAIVGGLQWKDDGNEMIAMNSDLTLTVHQAIDTTNGLPLAGKANGTASVFGDLDDAKKFVGIIHYDVARVPEPATLALLGLGLLGLGFSRRKRA